MKLFVVNVGVNTYHASSLGLRSPVFADGTFEFVPIPEDEEFHGREGILTYNDLPSWSGSPPPLAAYVPAPVRGYGVHNDPEFVTYTYGDRPTARAANLRGACPGDQLWFIARLWDHDGHAWGQRSDFHLIGLIELEENLVIRGSTALPCLPTALRQRIANNAHHLRLVCGDTMHSRIILGSMTSSRRFRRAMRVTPEVAGLLFGGNRGPDGLYRRNGVIRENKNGLPRTFERLGSITRSIQPFLDTDVAGDRSYIEALALLAEACCASQGWPEEEEGPPRGGPSGPLGSIGR